MNDGKYTRGSMWICAKCDAELLRSARHDAQAVQRLWLKGTDPCPRPAQDQRQGQRSADGFG